MAIAATDIDKKSWGITTIHPVWDDSYKVLTYINEPFNDSHTVECWKQQGFNGVRFTGDLYDMRMPEPHWIGDIRSQLPLVHFSWSLYRMSPGTILPWHQDTYQRFRDIYGVRDIATIVRYVIFLEPWQSGHYLEIDNEPVVKWQPGLAVYWNGNTPHMAANLGQIDRYTLQITGLIGDSV